MREFDAVARFLCPVDHVRPGGRKLRRDLCQAELPVRIADMDPAEVRRLDETLPTIGATGYAIDGRLFTRLRFTIRSGNASHVVPFSKEVFLAFLGGEGRRDRAWSEITHLMMGTPLVALARAGDGSWVPDHGIDLDARPPGRIVSSMAEDAQAGLASWLARDIRTCGPDVYVRVPLFALIGGVVPHLSTLDFGYDPQSDGPPMSPTRIPEAVALFGAN